MVQQSSNSTEGASLMDIYQFSRGIMIFQLSFAAILTLITFAVIFLKWRKISMPKFLEENFTKTILVNFLEERQDRLTAVSTFGMISMYVLKELSGATTNFPTGNAFATMFMWFILTLLICFICMPFFIGAAIGTYPSLILGLIYILIYIILMIRLRSLFISFNPKCAMLSEIVTILLLIVFGIVIIYGYCRKIYLKMTLRTSESKLDMLQKVYVSDLLKSHQHQIPLYISGEDLRRAESFTASDTVIIEESDSSCWKKYLNQSTGFQFSLSILVSVTVGATMATQYIATALDYIICVKSFIDKVILKEEAVINCLQSIKVTNVVQSIIKKVFKRNVDLTNSSTIYEFIMDQYHVVFGSLFTSVFITLIFFIFTILHMLKSYKSNVQSLQRHQQPAHLLQIRNRSNVSIVFSAVQYCGYQVAFFLWGVSVQYLSIVIVCLIFSELVILPIKYAAWPIIGEYFFPILITIVLTRLVQRVFIKYVFLQEKGRVLGLRNRKHFFNMMYFMFFYNIFLGFFACLMRAMKSVVFGIWFLPRLDRSVFPRTFEELDYGFRSYTCLLKLEMLQRNLVLLSAVKILSKSDSIMINRMQLSSTVETQLHRDKRRVIARNRWYLAYTLMKNPSLIADRRGYQHPQLPSNIQEEGFWLQCIDLFPFLDSCRPLINR